MYRYIYGPVPSRRLGISLGIDLVPRKYCTLNCVYCECGATDHLTAERKEYFSIEAILNELRDFLDHHPMPDWLTLSGSGEPTLNSGMGKLIRTVKEEYPDSKFAVLTNGMMLCDSEVREELYSADLILPNLDAATPQAFLHIDRPLMPFCSFDSLEKFVPYLIDQIAEFTHRFKAVSPDKEVRLEVFIVDGINTDQTNIDAFRDAFLKIEPDLIQLNTLDRPGTNRDLKPASMAVLQEVKDRLGLDNVEIISRYKARNDISSYREDVESMLTDTLSRRPCTIEDLSEILQIPVYVLYKYLDILKHEHKLNTTIQDRGIFYSLRNKK